MGQWQLLHKRILRDSLLLVASVFCFLLFFFFFKESFFSFWFFCVSFFTCAELWPSWSKVSIGKSVAKICSCRIWIYHFHWGILQGQFLAQLEVWSNICRFNSLTLLHWFDWVSADHVLSRWIYPNWQCQKTSVWDIPLLIGCSWTHVLTWSRGGDFRWEFPATVI